MREYLELGPCPYDENLVQVGEENYQSRSRAECQRFIDLLREKFGPDPKGAELSIRMFPHDLGSYYEVVCYFDRSEDDTSLDYALRLEHDCPATWDPDA